MIFTSLEFSAKIYTYKYVRIDQAHLKNLWQEFCEFEVENSATHLIWLAKQI